MDKIRGINQSVSTGDNITVTDTNINATGSTTKRRQYQRKRKEGTIEDPKVPTPPIMHTVVKSEYDEKEMEDGWMGLDSDGRERDEIGFRWKIDGWDWIQMEDGWMGLDSDGRERDDNEFRWEMDGIGFRWKMDGWD
ncbi:Uncharacterized protein BM_BM18097 [Brugia malayi]|uniref:Uncharacterized protein n=1 Tax=Brugia malayi TaxID=6279 RepID=A0A4E9EZS3_BRUMA|nr:Uncharacterized protein BM_BM18097 [Brugia malayi]VIO89983.1 Uncharacterized protein BM_BM18097 [Brugia malayi]